MNLKHTLEALKTKTFLLVFINIIFLVLPGIVFLFLYYLSLFIKLETVKVVLLACSITAPLAFINTTILGGKNINEKTDEDNFADFTGSTLLSGISLYTAILIGHITEASATIVITFSVIFDFFILYLEHRKSNKK